MVGTVATEIIIQDCEHSISEKAQLNAIIMVTIEKTSLEIPLIIFFAQGHTKILYCTLWYEDPEIHQHWS